MAQTERQSGAVVTREQGIVRTSIVGILANIALAAFKAGVGLLSHSIAIVLDAVNNLSDALSSIITIIGARFAAKGADRDHPFGHGRAEYITTIVIAVIILWAGATSLWESIQRILTPEQASYSVPSLVIIVVAVAAKLALGSYFKRQGEALASSSLVASGQDARMDAILSAGTLVAALVNMHFGLGLEAWVGLVISGFILKAGYDVLQEAISKILGERVDAEVSTTVRDIVRGVDGVEGAYDLILTDYGPERIMGSVHVEVDEGLTARDIDMLTRTVQQRVLEQSGVVLHTVGVYSKNSHDAELDEAAAMRDELKRLAEASEHVLETHGLFVDADLKTARFDVVVSFDAPDRRAVMNQLVRRMQQAFPGYEFSATLDSDISD